MYVHDTEKATAIIFSLLLLDQLIHLDCDQDRPIIMPVRLGIIGLSANKTAWATAAHAAPLKSPALADKYKITAIATSSPESAKAAANFHGVPEDKAYHSAEAIAKDPDVDMVVVSVKLPLHKELTIPALNARKPVLVEWPMGNGLKEAEEMAALAKKQGVKTAVGLQARLSPAVQKVTRAILDLYFRHSLIVIR